MPQLGKDDADVAVHENVQIMMCIALPVLSALSAHDLLFTLYLCINGLRQEVTMEWSKIALSSFVACSAELAACSCSATQPKYLLPDVTRL